MKKYIYIKNLNDTVYLSEFKEYFEDEDGDYVDFVNVGEKHNAECLIDINELIKELQKYKSDGATHVSVEPHSDHGELNLYPFEIRDANPGEIGEFYSDETISIENAKALKIAQLEEELQKLKNS